MKPGALQKITKITSGFAFKSTRFGRTGNLPLIRIRDVKRGYSDTYYSGEYNQIYIVNDGDVLIGMDGEFNVEKWQGGRALLNQRVCKIEADGNDLDEDYLYYFLPKELKKIERETPSVTVKHLSVKKIKAIEIPLPPLPEQKRIAAILDKADAIRRKRQAAIKLADDFLRATFLDMFGDPVTNPKGWVVKPIGELLADKPSAARTGPFGSQLKYSEFTEEGVPVLGIDNVVTNYFRWTTPRCLPPEKYENFKRYRVFPDDIIITIMGTTGRVAVAPSDLPKCMSTKHLCVLTLNKKVTDPVFLWATLLFDNKVRGQAKRSSGGAIMEGWNMGAIKAIHVRVPPLNNQLKFRKIIERTQKLKKQMLTWEADGSSQLFNSLSQRAFRGEL